jgi:hypothetical protein
MPMRRSVQRNQGPPSFYDLENEKQPHNKLNIKLLWGFVAGMGQLSNQMLLDLLSFSDLPD